MNRFVVWPRESKWTFTSYSSSIISFRKTNIVEHMFKMMEKHSSRLEEKVKIRMNELENEKRKKEVLINRMLPP